MLLVHDLRSKNVLRELNLVDSGTSLENIHKCKIVCSPEQGRKFVVLAGDRSAIFRSLLRRMAWACGWPCAHAMGVASRKIHARRSFCTSVSAPRDSVISFTESYATSSGELSASDPRYTSRRPPCMMMESITSRFNDLYDGENTRS